MSKTAMLSVLLPLLLIALPSSVAQAPTCTSLAKIRLVVTGGGFCRAKAQASCDAVSVQKVQSDVAVNGFFSDTPCSPAKAQSAARSVATAIASVWASSLVQVECTGAKVKSNGCGFAQGVGNSLTVAWTEAIAIAAASASSPDGSQNAFCVADIRALVPVLAKAFALAQSQLCVNAKGPVSALAFQNAAQSSIATAVGEAFAAATASFCGKNVQSACEGEAGSTGSSSAGTQGHVSGGVFVNPGQGSGSSTGAASGTAAAPFDTACTGGMAKCCSASSYPCTCIGCALPVKFERFEFSAFGMQKHLTHGNTHCLCH